jgi:2-polyprenyl-3-methyl-5-hydroxy-6-metoxy-1,4-benzoquinol methylase
MALLVGVALLIYVLTRFPFDDVVRACIEVGPLVVVTPFIALGWFACNTSALYVLLDRRVPWRDLLWNRLVGDGYNSLLPLGGIGGEPWKLRHLTEFVEVDHALSAMIRDRVLENAVGLIVTGVAIAGTMAAYPLPIPLETGLLMYASISSGVGVLGLAFVVTRLPGRAARLAGKWLGADTATPPKSLPLRDFLIATAWCLAGRIVGLCEIGALLWILDLGVDPVAILFLDSVLNAVGFISFTIPQGLGVFEGSSVYLFGILGFAGPTAIAFALARRGRMLLIGLVGVSLHLVMRMFQFKEQPVEVWDSQFRSGHWQCLDSGAQVAHYAVIAGYVSQLFAQPRILDVGCGHGRLYRMLKPLGHAAYHGLDVSAVAIGDARALADERASFAVASFDDAATGQWDVIIFNESLYYASRPVAVLRRFAPCLAEGGVFIISMHLGKQRNRAIWRAVALGHETVLSSRIRNERGLRWDVRVLRPRLPERID